MAPSQMGLPIVLILNYNVLNKISVEWPPLVPQLKCLRAAYYKLLINYVSSNLRNTTKYDITVQCLVIELVPFRAI